MSNVKISHLGPLVRLGIPLVIGQLGTIAQGFADTIMVGQYGTPELSASGFVNNVFNLIIFFLLGFSYSTTPIVGTYFGRKSYEKCGRTAKESLFSNLCVCLLIMLLLYLLYLNIDHLGQPSELLPLIRPYYLIILFSLPFMSAFNSLKQFCEGTGDTRSPMWIMLIGNVVNIILNYLLIYGFRIPFTGLDIGAMGLNGAGYATLFSRFLMFVIIILFVSHHHSFRIFRPGFHLPMTLKGVFHISRVGFPISLQLSLEAASFNITGVMMGWLGAAALASHQVMCTIGSLCFMFYYGIGAAAAVRISHFRGAGKHDELRRISFTAYKMSLVWALLLTTLIVVFFRPLCYCFTTSDNVVDISVGLLIPFVLYQFGDATQVIYANCLRAIEDVKSLMWYAFIAYLVVSVPASYLFAFCLGMGTTGIWYGFPLGLTTAGVLFLCRYLKKTKIRK